MNEYTESSETKINSVRFEVFTAVAMKNAVFWDVTPCGPCKNRRFAGTYLLHIQGEKNRRARNLSSNSQPKHGSYKGDTA
jgi:hypothetical protein